MDNHFSQVFFFFLFPISSDSFCFCRCSIVSSIILYLNHCAKLKQFHFFCINYDFCKYFFSNIFTKFLQYWKDDFLQWNPDDYDGATEIFLSSNDIWIPEFSLYYR